MAENNTIQFSIAFSLDKEEFFRRTCPNCGGEFKTKADPNDLSSILQPAFKRIESDIGEISLPTLDTDQIPRYLSCPYCEHKAKSSDMMTEELYEYLKRFVMREYILPQVNAILSEFSDGLKRTSRSNNLFRIEIKVDSDSTMPPRPISGPEPPDMTAIEMLCCGKSIKVRDGYFDINKCPLCGELVELM